MLELHDAEHHLTWLRELRAMRGLTKLVDALQDGDVDFMRSLISWKNKPPRVAVSYTWPGATGPSQYTLAREGRNDIEDALLARWSRLDRDAVKYGEPLRHFLFNQINQRLREHVSPVLVPDRGVELRPDSLLGAMYVTLAEEFTKEEWPTKSCVVCGKPLGPGRSDQKTCSGACRKRLSRPPKTKTSGAA